MNEPVPGKRAFYKYLTPETTLAVLESGNLRYSSPLRFNDPFDVQSALHWEFDFDSLANKLTNRIEALAQGSEPLSDSADPSAKLVRLAREHFPTKGFERRFWLPLIHDMVRHLQQGMQATREEYLRKWKGEILPAMRVFCVSEERDNLLMWAHYARDHTGAVMELWSLPEEDNPLSVASQVEYADSPIPFFTESEWIDDFTGQRRLDTTRLYRRYAYVKGMCWAYEREWRVWDPSGTGELFDDRGIRPNEFQAIYFGCRADPDFIQQAQQLLASRFPHVRCYQARKDHSRYGLLYG